MHASKTKSRKKTYILSRQNIRSNAKSALLSLQNVCLRRPTHLSRKSIAPQMQANCASNVSQRHLKHISNLQTSSTRAPEQEIPPTQLGSKHNNPTTHLKDSKDFRKRKLSSLRPFAIPSPTRIVLQPCLP